MLIEARWNGPDYLCHVTVSMRVMSAGDGYKYFLRSVAAADGDRSLPTPLTRYYGGGNTSGPMAGVGGRLTWPRPARGG